MDPLEMLTSPFKLNYRYSPLVSELPAGFKRELRFIFGDHVTFDAAERFVYARERGALPADLVTKILKPTPYCVVVPRERGDLVEALRLAERHGLPVTPRGNGTSTNAAAVPAEGGIVVDMRVFHRIHGLDKDEGIVECDPGVTFEQLASYLAPHGLAPLVEPELAWAATVGGSVALGRHGIGSAQWGSISEQCVEASVLTPDRKLETFRGADLDLVRGMQGSTGIILSVKLKVGMKEDLQPFLGAFERDDQAAQAFRGMVGAQAWHVAVLSPGFVELRQDASGVKGLQEKWHVLAAFPKGSSAESRVRAVMEGAGGKVLDAKAADKEWSQRHNAISIHRLGPTVVTAECIVPIERLTEALRDLPGAARGRIAFDAIAASSASVLVRVRMLEDERRLEFPTSIGNLLAVVDAAHNLGGHAAYPSMLLAGDARLALGEQAWQKLSRFKAKRDPWEVMNPGKVWPARMRGMPMAQLPLFLKTQKPILKLLRGAVPYKGADGERSGDVAMANALGRARSGEVASLSDALHTCSHCGLCNTTSPDVGIWESQRPRGAVQVAIALLQGEGRWTEHLRDNAFRLPLQRAGDALCPSKIPILEAALATRTELVRTLGPLPAHEGIAANVAKEGNPLGKPKALRAAWLPQGFAAAAGAKALYYAGCTASYDRPSVALAGLELMRKLGPVNSLGAQEPCCGHTLLWTGQREAAAKQAEAAMKAILKAGCEMLVTPDALCAWTMRNFWPQVAEEKGIAWNVQAKHAPEHLLPLVGKGLALANQVAEQVHFTEPCCAADASSLKLLQKVPGLQVQVLPILPCGATGGMRLAHADVPEIASLRALATAKAAGAQTIVTSNPLCEAQLADVSQRAQHGIAVVDVLQIVARAAGIALPGEAPPGAPAPAAAPSPAPAGVPAAKPKLTPEELEKRKQEALAKAAAAKAARPA